MSVHVVNSSSVNSFKNNLDRLWSNQEVYYNFICDTETLKPSSSAFAVRPEWPVGCSLAVSVQTRSGPKITGTGNRSL